MMERGKRSRTAHLDVWNSPSPAAQCRVGLVVPRHGHRVVDRNRLKRRLREILRTEVMPRLRAEDACIDILIRARREAYALPQKELRAELHQWLERAWPGASS
jgi:ribonuclease P protein component